MADNGYILLHRKILDWQWFSEPKVLHVFLYLLLKANHKPSYWRGVLVDRGQHITSYETIANATGLSVQNTRTSVRKLIFSKEITCKSTNKFTLVTIVNWDLYQFNNEKLTSKLTNNQQTTNKQLTTNNNDNNDNNILNIINHDNYNKSYISDLEKSHSSEPKKNVIAFKKPSLDEVKQYCIDNNKNVDAVSFWNFYEAKDWMIGKNKMKYWKAAIATWEKRNKPANAVSVPYYSDQIED